MVKRVRKAPKRKASATHHKRSRVGSEHAHTEGASFSKTKQHALTKEEKHTLIRVHGEMRREQKQLGVGYYAAIVICCVVVGGGWLFTLRQNFGLSVSTGPDAIVQTLQDGVESFKHNTAVRLPEVKRDFEAVGAGLGINTATTGTAIK